MEREHDVCAGCRRVQQRHELTCRLRIIDIARSVQRRHEVVLWQAELCAHAIGIEAVQVGEKCVDHGIAHQVDAICGHPLVREMRDGIGAGAQQEIGEAIGDDAVDLLGHRHVEGPQPRLDVSDRHAELARRDRGSQCGVHVAVHDDHLGLGAEQLLF